MHQSENFVQAIPADYVLVKHVNANNDKKQMAIYTVLSFVPLVFIAPVLVVIAIFGCGFDFAAVPFLQSTLTWSVVGVGLILYAVLHELTHGITYKIYTGGKLTYGFNLVVAFCGVPDLYVRKRASIAALAMPFAVFNVVFLGLTVGLWFVSPLYGVAAGIVFALHLGGCVGDLHWLLLYHTRFKHCHTLMRDTGPEQWLYVPRTEAEQYGIKILTDDKGVANV